LSRLTRQSLPTATGKQILTLEGKLSGSSRFFARYASRVLIDVTVTSLYMATLLGPFGQSSQLPVYSPFFIALATATMSAPVFSGWFFDLLERRALFPLFLPAPPTFLLVMGFVCFWLFFGLAFFF
jgi:hypothetical protein